MAYFPEELPPKRLKRETSAEVDNSPNLYNARDYNIHLREVLALAKYLVGRGTSVETDGSVLGLVSTALSLFRNITDGGLVTTHSGVVPTGTRVPIPSTMANTLTSGALTTGATTITVVSTANFPVSGKITKFNAVVPGSTGSNLVSQEVITYTGKTATTFTGCTRAVEGTAQAVAADKTALILPGKASILFGHGAWKNGNSAGVLSALAQHDASLLMSGQIDVTGTASVQTYFNVAYCLTVVGSFENVDLSTVLG